MVGAILRFPTIAQQSLWTDEATTWSIVSHSLGHVISTVPRTESTPPVFYVALWLWTRVFGLGPFWLRSLSAVCGVLTIWVMALTGRRLGGVRLGVAAAALTAVNPIMVWYSQEARAYAMVILLAAVSVWALLRVLEEPSVRRLVTWSGVAGLALAVHYFAVFVILPEAAWLVWVLGSRRLLGVRSVLAAFGPLVVIGAALLPLLIHQADAGHATFIATADGSLPRRMVRLVKEDILGLNEPLKAVLSAIAILLIAAALGLLVFRPRDGARRTAWLPVCVGAGGVVLALLAAGVGSDYVNTRNLLPTWPMLALVVCCGLTMTRSAWVGGFGLAALCVLSLVCDVAVVVTPLYQRADWRDIAHALGPARERIIVGDNYSLVSLAPYMHGLHLLGAGKSATATEIDIFGLALQSTPPPRAVPAPSIPGFTLVRRRETTTYTLLRYVATRPTSFQAASVVRYGLMPGPGENHVLVQQGRRSTALRPQSSTTSVP